MGSLLMTILYRDKLITMIMIMMMTTMITLHAFLMRNLSCFSFFTKALLAAASPADTVTASAFDLSKKFEHM